MRVGMADLEDLVYFFMNAPLDKPFSKAILASVLCKINDVPDGDAVVAQDVDAWLENTKQKLHAAGRRIP
jgi:hypothetical protein